MRLQSLLLCPLALFQGFIGKCEPTFETEYLTFTLDSTFFYSEVGFSKSLSAFSHSGFVNICDLSFVGEALEQNHDTVPVQYLHRFYVPISVSSLEFDIHNYSESKSVRQLTQVNQHFASILLMTLCAICTTVLHLVFFSSSTTPPSPI